MAQYLFQLNKKHTAIINEDAVKLCPEMAKLTPKQALFVILFRDYASPYHQQPEHERLLRAKRQVFNTSDCAPETEKVVIEAMRVYESLQYDQRRIQMQRYKDKLEKMSEEVLNSINYKEIAIIDGAIELINKRLAGIQDELVKLALDEHELKGGQSMSFIEKWQEKQREYLRAEQLKAEQE